MTTNRPNITIADASAHISGYHNPKEIDPATGWYDDEPLFLVGFQCGFEMHVIAVYGYGLCEGDAECAAEEWLSSKGWKDEPKASYSVRIR